MTNTTKQAMDFEGMDNKEKAQVIYNKLLHDQGTTLASLLLDLSSEYSDGNRVFTVDDWIDCVDGEDVCTIIQIAQLSRNLNINDKYIRESIYYTGYQTSDDILDLVNQYEAVEWIENALDDNLSYIEGFNIARLYQD